MRALALSLADASCLAGAGCGPRGSVEPPLAYELLRVGKTCAMTTTVHDLRTETAERAVSAKTSCPEDGLVDEIIARLRRTLG